jgi:hypothetical protein
MLMQRALIPDSQKDKNPEKTMAADRFRVNGFLRRTGPDASLFYSHNCLLTQSWCFAPPSRHLIPLTRSTSIPSPLAERVHDDYRNRFPLFDVCIWMDLKGKRG